MLTAIGTGLSGLCLGDNQDHTACMRGTQPGHAEHVLCLWLRLGFSLVGGSLSEAEPADFVRT